MQLFKHDDTDVSISFMTSDFKSNDEGISQAVILGRELDEVGGSWFSLND